MALREHADEMPTLNLTPMIDVLFLLIIFFVVGTKFIEAERQIELKLPQVAPNQALSAAPEKKVVNVYRDGQITLDSQAVSLEELKTKLSAAHGQYRALGVLVRGDGATAFERVANVLSVCKQAGISDLAISVEVATAPKDHATR